jgi:hypothetical protein
MNMEEKSNVEAIFPPTNITTTNVSPFKKVSSHAGPTLLPLPLPLP